MNFNMITTKSLKNFLGSLMDDLSLGWLEEFPSKKDLTYLLRQLDLLRKEFPRLSSVSSVTAHKEAGLRAWLSLTEWKAKSIFQVGSMTRFHIYVNLILEYCYLDGKDLDSVLQSICFLKFPLS